MGSRRLPGSISHLDALKGDEGGAGAGFDPAHHPLLSAYLHQCTGGEFLGLRGRLGRAGHRVFLRCAGLGPCRRGERVAAGESVTPNLGALGCRVDARDSIVNPVHKQEA